MKDELLGDKTKLFMDYRKVVDKIKKYINLIIF